MIRVSAILPCFNHSHFLPERIRSVLSQTRPVDEIIFLDDASTDDSLSLARKLLHKAHCPVVIKPNAINSGSTFKQWNKGVNLASGDLVWIAETDDSCDSSLLDTLLNCYQQNRATFAWAQSMVIDEAGIDLHSAREWHQHLFPGLFDRDFTMDGDLFVREYLSCVNLIPNASAVLFPRSKYIEAGPANELMRYAGDWLQWIKLIQGGNVCFVSQELNYFRCHPATTRSNPAYRSLHSEFLVCMTTALALTTQHSLNIVRARDKVLIKPYAIVSNLKNKYLLNKMLISFTLGDILALNYRIRSKGGSAYLSFRGHFWLGWLTLTYYCKKRLMFIMSRLRKCFPIL